MPRSMLLASLCLVVTAFSSAPAALHAQDEDGDKDKAPGGEGMPTFTGRGKVTEAINGDTGAIFDIGGGVTMTFPKGLPVGRSRLVTLAKARGIPSKLAHERFTPVGPALDFSGAFSTGRSPIVLAIASKRDPVKRGTKLVVAMEVGTFCEGDNKAFKLKGGLCSGFELQEAEYDRAGQRMVA